MKKLRFLLKICRNRAGVKKEAARLANFVDSGYYKFYEAYHLLKFSNEKQILEKAYNEYRDLKKANLWGSKKYF
mgnify:CR=1 FL=1